MSEENTSIALKSSELPVKNGKIDVPGFNIPVSELPVASVRLVHALSKNVNLGNGKRADNGTFFNDATGEATPTIDFRVLCLDKGKVLDKKDPSKDYPAYFIVGYDERTLEVFYIIVGKSNYWPFRYNALPKLINALKNSGKQYDVLVTVSTITKTNADNEDYLVMDFKTDISQAPDPDMKNIFEGLVAKYDSFVKDKAASVTTGEVEEVFGADAVFPPEE